MGREGKGREGKGRWIGGCVIRVLLHESFSTGNKQYFKLLKMCTYSKHFNNIMTCKATNIHKLRTYGVVKLIQTVKCISP